MSKKNSIKSKTICGETTKEFDQRLNNFLNNDITIEQTFFNTNFSYQKHGMYGEPTEGNKVLFSCLIFYHDN